MSGKQSHPSAHNRSLGEPALIDTMNHILACGSRNERQLARMCKDLLILAGDYPNVKAYIDRKACEALDKEQPWG